MARARVIQRQFRSVSKRATDWAFSATSSAEINIPAASKVLLALFIPASFVGLTPSTIIRTRGRFDIGSDQEAASEVQIGAFGIGIVSETAGGVGVTAVPGPDNDPLWDGWFVHQFFQGDHKVTPLPT